MSLPGRPTNEKRPWHLVLLGLLTLLGAALRLWQTRESLWLDELHTAWCAGGSLAEVAPRAMIGNQSPLFFWLEWLLVQVFGPGEFVLRLPSVIAGSLLPVAIYSLCKRWHQPSGVGLLAAALIAVDPLSIFFATEARPYALVQLLAVMHIGIAAELFAQPSLALRIAWIAGAGLLFHLHYTAALLIPAEVLFRFAAGYVQPGAMRYRWSCVAIDALLIGCLYLPASGGLLEVYGRRENWAAFVPARSAWAPWVVLNVLPWSPEALVLAAILLVVALLRWPFQRTNLSDPQVRLNMLCVVSWLIVPTLLAWLATATGVARLFFPRYLAASAPAAMLLVALTVNAVGRRWFRWISAGILLSAVVTSGIAQQFSLIGRAIWERQEDWRSAIAWFNQRLEQEDRCPILVASGLIEADALLLPHGTLLDDYCLFPVTSLYPIAAERSDLIPLPFRNFEDLQQPVRERFIAEGRMWLIVRGRRDRGRNVADRLLNKTSGADQPSRDWWIEESKFFPGVQIFLIRHHAPNDN